MPSNVILNKIVSASSFVAPYAPSRAVDGITNQPTNRWLCKQLPGWIQANLGANIYVDRWVVRFMPTVGWQAPSFCLSNLQLQASLDGQNWTTIDSVAGNTAPVIDRTFTPVSAQYMRIVVLNGLLVNPGLASLVEWEVYESPQTSNNLTSLTTSSGTLQPPFTSNNLSYTENVGFDIAGITVTPTAEDPQAVIKVNGVVVSQSNASAQIGLTEGVAVSIPVLVTPVRGNAKTYTLNVTKSSNPYLSSLQVLVGRNVQTIQPAFSQGTYSYQCSVAGTVTTVVIKPVAVDPTATVKVNETVVTTAVPSVAVPLTGTTTTISVTATSSKGQDQRSYSIVVTRIT